MNEKDKEAFEEWFNCDLPELPKLHDAYERHIWQAACEYKQKEIDELKDQIDHQDSLIFELDQNVQVFMEKTKALQAENTKLREALAYIAKVYDRPTDMKLKARQVLKELDGK